MTLESDLKKLNAETERHELRDDQGQYAVGFERLCKCGHPKGSHLAGRKGNSLGACIVHEIGLDGMGSGPPDIPMCDCEKFRAAPIKKARGKRAREEAQTKLLLARKELQAAMRSGDPQRIVEAQSEARSRQLALEALEG